MIAYSWSPKKVDLLFSCYSQAFIEYICIYTNIYNTMKKIITSLLTILAISSIAQNPLKIEDAANVGPDIANGIVTLTDLASVFEFALDLHVINTSTAALELKMRTTEMDVCSNTTSATCWSVCPPYSIAGASPTQISAFSLTIAPEDTASVCSLHYKPQNLDCCSMFKYEWIDIDNGNAVVAELMVRYDHTSAAVCQVSVQEEEGNTEVLISPNPANSEVLIALNGVDNFNGISIDIFDLLGKKVGSLSNIVNKNKMDVSAFNNGVYFVSIMKYGSLLKTTKLIVE